MNRPLQFLNRPVNIKALVEKLALDEDSLEEAVMEQSKLYLEAGRYRALKMRKRAQRVFEFERALAGERNKMRQKKDDQGRKTFTEGAVSDRAMIAEDMAYHRRRMDEAYAQEDLAKTLVECYRQRSQMLKIIADIRVSETSSSLRATRENMARDEMDKIRKRARERADALGEEDDGA